MSRAASQLPAVTTPRAPEIWLTTEVCAGLIGRSVWTLQRARHDRLDLDMPPAVRIGSRTIRYPLTDVIFWAYRRNLALDWSGVPLSFALPAFDAFEAVGLRVPADLAGKVRRGRP